jgi:hypothetical protein
MRSTGQNLDRENGEQFSADSFFAGRVGHCDVV